jgi:hypothetical protein
VTTSDKQNFAVAEEQKRKRQIEEFIRKAEPISAHVSWIDRLNPYRLMSANRNAVKVNTLPPNLVLPLKQNVGPDVGGLPSKVSVDWNYSLPTGRGWIFRYENCHATAVWPTR